jgi:hypothetical protein
MNNRMQEFVQEAIHNEPFDCGALTKDQWLQKFAELIVRECASIIESQDVDPTFKNRMSWAMKERFGLYHE